MIYLNFAYAFDRVPFRRLLHKIEHFEVRSDLLKWVQAFLMFIRFRVRVSGAFGRFANEVPEGLVLSPILFSL